MKDSPYGVQVERGLNLLVGAVRKHHQGFVRKGFLGESPTQEQFRASLFEIGCLHLFMLDQVLRADYAVDTFLGEVSMRYGNWLLSMFPQSHNNPAYGELLSGRLRAYAESISFLPGDGRDAAARRDDLLFALTGQLLRVLQADIRSAEEVFLGTVETADFDAGEPEETRRLVRGVKENLYEYLIPMQQTAVLWSHETPFYQKSVDTLNALVRDGERQALEIWREHCEPRNTNLTPLWWGEQHDSGATFRLMGWPGSAPSNWEEGEITKEYDPNAFPYLRVTPDPDGFPLRKLLLLAHTLRAGLVASVNDGKEERAPLDIRLSLGEVDSLLRGGRAGLIAREPLPDLSEAGHLSSAPTDFYYLPTPARLSLFRLYLDSKHKMQLDAENTLPAQPWDPIVERLSPQVTQSLQTFPASDENDAVVRASWVRDASGAGALAIGPVTDAEVARYIRWLVAPGTTVILESEPKRAQHALGYSKEGNVSGVQEAMESHSEIAEAIVGDSSARFLRTDEMVFGSTSGEPYDVVRRTDDPVVGRPLLDFTLPAYDGGRGLALRAEDGKLIWWNSFGEVITFLWEQELERKTPENAREPEAQTQPMGRKRRHLGNGLLPPPSTPASAPDMITLPDLSRANIAWVLVRSGVPNPQMGMVKENGQTKLNFGPPPPLTEGMDIVRWRIDWYLPRGARDFAFQYAPVLIPVPMPYTAR